MGRREPLRRIPRFSPRAPLFDSTPARMGRSGDDHIAKSDPHHWVEALVQPLEDGRKINKSALVALKLSRQTQKAPDNITETSRNITVIYSKIPTRDSQLDETNKTRNPPKQHIIQPPTTSQGGEEKPRTTSEPGKLFAALQALHRRRKA